METINFIGKALDIRSFYHKIISSNIANVDTPGFKERDIDFQEELSKRVFGSRDIAVKETATLEDGLDSLDGNTVDIENQMVKLTENSLLYNTLVHVVSKKFSMMRYLINEGRR